MSRDSRDELVATLGQAVRANQATVDAFDEATAQKFGVNRTDLRCLDLLMKELGGETTPGQLGTRLGLTTGSVTAMVDRLAKLGYVTRSPDPTDRRKVVVRPTDTILDKSRQIYARSWPAGWSCSPSTAMKSSSCSSTFSCGPGRCRRSSSSGCAMRRDWTRASVGESPKSPYGGAVTASGTAFWIAREPAHAERYAELVRRELGQFADTLDDIAPVAFACIAWRLATPPALVPAHIGWHRRILAATAIATSGTARSPPTSSSSPRCPGR